MMTDGAWNVFERLHRKKVGFANTPYIERTYVNDKLAQCYSRVRNLDLHF